MRFLIILVSCLAFITFGCIKTPDQIKEDLVIKAMTDGQWYLSSFTKNSNDITSDFTGYRYQFHKDNKVDALKNGVTETSGTWSADASAKTITSAFPSATAPVQMLNGTWNITKNSWTYVEATKTVSGDVYTLRLDK